MDEILRVLNGLQVSDTNGVALPLNCKTGDCVIVPPPKNLDEMQERIDDDYPEKTDFYPIKKNL